MLLSIALAILAIQLASLLLAGIGTSEANAAIEGQIFVREMSTIAVGCCDTPAHADSFSLPDALRPVTCEEQVLKAKEEEVEELRRELALLRNPGQRFQTYPRFGFGYTWMHLNARDT